MIKLTDQESKCGTWIYTPKYVEPWILISVSLLLVTWHNDDAAGSDDDVVRKRGASKTFN